MLRHDYILRLISQIMRAVARLLGKMKDAPIEEVEADLDSAMREFSGLGFDVLDSLSLKSLLDIMRENDDVDPGRCLAIAELCTLRSQMLNTHGDERRAAPLRIKAVALYLEAFLAFRHEALIPAELRMEQLLAGLPTLELPDEVLLRLFRYRATTGDFANAEDALYELLERHPDDGAIRTEGRSFYERLLALPDAELDAGDLPRDEVEEGLQGVTPN